MHNVSHPISGTKSLVLKKRKSINKFCFSGNVTPIPTISEKLVRSLSRTSSAGPKWKPQHAGCAINGLCDSLPIHVGLFLILLFFPNSPTHYYKLADHAETQLTVPTVRLNECVNMWVYCLYIYKIMSLTINKSKQKQYSNSFTIGWPYFGFHKRKPGAGWQTKWLVPVESRWQIPLLTFLAIWDF